VKVLLDTDVLVDCLRAVDAALQWINNSATDTFQVPGIVAMELVTGCRNKAELLRIRKFLDDFDVVWPDAKEFERAFLLLEDHYLSNSTGIPDCIIAAMALERSICLYSFNVKHFGLIAGLDVRQPYQRSPLG